jgi:hypothetical protein
MMIEDALLCEAPEQGVWLREAAEPATTAGRRLVNWPQCTPSPGSSGSVVGGSPK